MVVSFDFGKGGSNVLVSAPGGGLERAGNVFGRGRVFRDLVEVALRLSGLDDAPDREYKDGNNSGDEKDRRDIETGSLLRSVVGTRVLGARSGRRVLRRAIPAVAAQVIATVASSGHGPAFPVVHVPLAADAIRTRR
jgi:hypothetical protein